MNIKNLVKKHGRPQVCIMLQISAATLERYLKNGIPNCKKGKINEHLKQSQNEKN